MRIAIPANLDRLSDADFRAVARATLEARAIEHGERALPGYDPANETKIMIIAKERTAWRQMLSNAYREGAELSAAMMAARAGKG